MISRVIGEKVEKKVEAAQQPLLPAGGTPGAAGMLALPQLKPGGCWVGARGRQGAPVGAGGALHLLLARSRLWRFWRSNLPTDPPPLHTRLL